MDVRKAFIGFLLLSLFACLPVKTVFSEAETEVSKFNTCTTNIWTSGDYALTNSTDSKEGVYSLDAQFTSGSNRKIYPYDSFYPQYNLSANSFINWSGTSNYLGFWFKLIADNYGVNVGWFQYSSNVRAELQFWYDAGKHYLTLAVAGWYGADYEISLDSWYWFELFLDDTANSWDLHLNGTSIRSGSGYDAGFTSEACVMVSVSGSGVVNEHFRLDYVRLANCFEWLPTNPPTLYEWFSNTGFESGVFSPWTIDDEASYISDSTYHSGTHSATIFAPEYLDMDFSARYSKSANTSKVRFIFIWYCSTNSDGENATFRLVYNDTSHYDVSVFTGENIDWHFQDLTSYLNLSLSLTNFQIYDVQIGINAGLDVDDIYFISSEAPRSGNSFDTQTLVSNATLKIALKIDGVYQVTPFTLGDSGSHNIEAPKFWIINATHAYQFVNWSDGSGSTERILSGAEIYIVFYTIAERDRIQINEAWYNFGIGMFGVGLIFTGFYFLKTCWVSGEYAKALGLALICWMLALGFITVLIGA